MPEQVNGFSKGRKDDDEIIYIHDDDGTVVTAEKNRDGEWSVTAFVQGTEREQTLATGLEGADAAMSVLVDYMEQYQPESDTANDSGGLSAARAAEEEGGMADETMAGSDGDGLLSKASGAGQKIASKAADAASGALNSGDNSSSAADLFGTPDRDGPTALERLSDDRDRRRSSPLFDDTMRGSAGPGMLDEMGRDRDGPSAFDKLSDDRDRRRSSALFDETMRGGDGPSVFDEMGRDRDGPSAFEKLSDDRDSEDRLSRLRNAEDSNDLYGGR